MSEQRHDPRPEAHAHGGHEEDVLPRRALYTILAVTVAVTVALIVWAWRIQVSREAALGGPPPAGRRAGPMDLPPPKIETALFDRATRARVLAEGKRAQLSSFGWVDRDRGVVRIPIERAMELVVAGEGPR